MADNIILDFGQRSGEATVPSSKSQAHRLLICAALTLFQKHHADHISSATANQNKKILLHCVGLSKDIEATLNCLKAMGIKVEICKEVITLSLPDGIKTSKDRVFKCGESGSTLRFLLPVASALGQEAIFHMEGRLPERPMEPLTKVLSQHGVIFKKNGELLHSRGQLNSGVFELPGNISSQYISGLLMALPLLEKDSRIRIIGKIESVDYITMTEEALRLSGIEIEKIHTTEYLLEYIIKGSQQFNIPTELAVEADWSGAAFFLSLGALSEKGVTLLGMNMNSSQGDMRIVKILEKFGAKIKISDTKSLTRSQKDGKNTRDIKDIKGIKDISGKTELSQSYIFVQKEKLQGIELDASLIPDLVPVIAVVAAGADGVTTISGAERLRIKESDRLATTCEMLNRLGAKVEVASDGLIIHGKPRLKGGEVDSHNDHRIAMSAAVAASLCTEKVIVNNASCVQKSFPDFWEKFEILK